MGIDLMFLALVAGVLIFRLYSTLGKEDPHTQERVRHIKENLARELGEITERGLPSSHDTEPFDDVLNLFRDSERPFLSSLHKNWPEFSPVMFVEGAKKAYVFIVESFAAGQKEVIKPLVSQDLYNTFATIMDAREKKGEVHQHTVNNVRSLRFVDTSFKGKVATITLDIHSFQTHTSKDKDGNPLYETGEDLEEMWDRWVFSRDTTKAHHSWVLIKIEATPRDDRTE
ncbi:MAG: Tim44/TimA family putative adaptor protein [Alphaproteobacteria bacterium]|nr:MAG: Tim44/TimA family putative adaptor protein [Alphaproteobacteria bacterium]